MRATWVRIIFFLKRASSYVILPFIIFALTEGVFGQTSSLFDSDEVIELTLRSDLKSIFKDRGDDPQYHSASLHYELENKTINLPVKIKTRGHFRKLSGNCKYPPLKLNFSNSELLENSVFKGQDKLKLVTPCRGDKLVIQEYFVYKLYNLITPKSFNVRLVKVIYQDTVRNKSSDAYYGILIEDEDQMAVRNLSIMVDRLRVPPEETDRNGFMKMAVFQYMIGNTDWSVQYQQNLKLLSGDSAGKLSVVPYDFDHAGIVKAAYAKPAEALKLSSTLERRYRGFCISEMNEYTAVIEMFNQLKNEFYAVYTDNPLLSKKYQKQTIKFIDQFYKTINDTKKAKKAFSYPCNSSGTGNVVIQGMKK